MDDWKNKLYFGDNLDVMRAIPDEVIDLIYLDPPFNSNATYNVLFQEQNGTQSAAQIAAFEDTWHWDYNAQATYEEIVTSSPKKVADLIQALKQFLGQNDMMAYLVMMAIRLVEMHRILKPTGSIYLHCDPTASHYLKILMDSIFGNRNFMNEIIWYYGPKATQRSTSFQRKHDVIIFYAKDKDKNAFYPIYQEYSRASIKERGTRYKHTDEKGRFRLTTRRDADGNKYRAKVYLNEGVVMTDVWGIPVINATAKERLGYPTQKPEALLERIIQASSNEGDLILDPFCGCGTTIAVAERLNRRWVGIDITHLAITLMINRLEDTFDRVLAPYEIIGDPKDLPGAIALKDVNRYQFEWWSLGKVAARPAQDKKKGADKGLDGYIYFFDDYSRDAKKVVVQVKSGNVTVSQIRDLKGVMDREKAEIGAFLTLEKPTQPMVREAASTGFYESELVKGKKYPRLQILTIEEILEGKQLDYPKFAEGTFKRAQRKRKGTEKQGKLF